MVRKKLDERVRSLIERCVDDGTRGLFVLVGDHGKDQVVNLHSILSRSGPVRARPSVLWCYKKELGFSSHKRKRMKKLKRDASRGLLSSEDPNADPFELFVTSTSITWCYYRDSHRLLGNTYGVCVLQDFEALTPNLLARTIETVGGGGLVILLLRSVGSLRQLYTMAMDVHSRYRTEGSGDVVPRFNERFLLSLGRCGNCLVCDDELNVLPLSGRALKTLAVERTTRPEGLDAGDDAARSPAERRELRDLKDSLAETPHVGAAVALCVTLDQARAVLTFLEACSDHTTDTGGGRKTVALTAARGRGKSAAIGLCLAGALSLGYADIVVTAPEPENLVSVFEFLRRGLNALKYQEHLDYSVTYDGAVGREANKCVLAVEIKPNSKRVDVTGISKRQSVRYVRPEEHFRFAHAEIVAVDEAAAISLPMVKKIMFPQDASTAQPNRLTFLSSTINGYEGTGRALSLKLIKELRDATKGNLNANKSDVLEAAENASRAVAGARSKKGEAKVHEQRFAAAASAAAAAISESSSSPHLREIQLTTPIRYATGCPIESWLNKLLCLDCGSDDLIRLTGGAPAPADCELYQVDRDALFSHHRLSEAFLQKMMSLYCSAHYRNSPNDLQMLGDAPAHAVYALLSPSAGRDAKGLPDILAIVQVALEGKISRRSVEAQLARGHRLAGDLIPWTISQQFGDANFASLSGARVVRVAVHPAVQGMGYGSRTMELLYRFYNGEMVDLLSSTGGQNEDEDGQDDSTPSESEEEEDDDDDDDDDNDDGGNNDKKANDEDIEGEKNDKDVIVLGRVGVGEDGEISETIPGEERSDDDDVLSDGEVTEEVIFGDSVEASATAMEILKSVPRDIFPRLDANGMEDGDVVVKAVVKESPGKDGTRADPPEETESVVNGAKLPPWDSMSHKQEQKQKQTKEQVQEQVQKVVQEQKQEDVQEQNLQQQQPQIQQELQEQQEQQHEQNLIDLEHGKQKPDATFIVEEKLPATANPTATPASLTVDQARSLGLSKWTARLFDPDRPRGLIETPEIPEFNDVYLQEFGRREKEVHSSLPPDFYEEADVDEEIVMTTISKTTSPKKSQQPLPPGCKIRLSNLPYSTSREIVTKACALYGEIHELNLIRDRNNPSISIGKAYVTFTNPISAAELVEDMHGRQKIDGRFVRAEIVKNDARRRYSLGPGNGDDTSSGRYWDKIFETPTSQHQRPFSNTNNGNLNADVNPDFPYHSTYLSQKCDNYRMRRCSICAMPHDGGERRCPLNVTCFACGTPGHMVGVCPIVSYRGGAGQRAPPPRRMLCTACLRDGHHRWRCEHLNWGLPVTSNAICCICDEKGHYVCQEEDYDWKQVGGDIDDAPLSCFNCGGLNHHGANCDRPMLEECKNGNFDIGEREVERASAM
mmetsp:Transcript_24756/g.56965  ORF Transcript_24756/g.56965 Transcript_24756/m.56965 type:complete len:1396 (-) Transcript_24756:1951-6138(-)